MPRSQGTPGGCQRLGAGAAGSAASAAARLCLAGGQAGGTIRAGRCQRRSLEAPPAPSLPGHQKFWRRRGCAGRKQASAFSPKKLPARSKKRQEEEEEAERGGWDPPTCISRASSPLQPMGQAPASFPKEAAGSGCEPRAAVGCKPLSGSAACRGSSGLGCSRVPPRTAPAARAGARCPPPKTPCRGDLCKVASPAPARRNTRWGWRGCRIAGGSGPQRVHNGKRERGEGSAAEKPHKHPAGATGAISTAQALRPPRPCHQAGPGPLATAPLWGFGGTARGSGVTAVPGGRWARGLGRPPGGPQSTQGSRGMQGSQGVQGDPKARMGIPKHTGGP